MKTSKFSEAQIAFILKQAEDGIPITEICRKACSALQVDRSLYTYKPKHREQADLKLRIRQICETRVRYGYRRVHVLLCREGWKVNAKKVYRLYTEMGLQLRNKTPKRRVKARLRDDGRAPPGPIRFGRWTLSRTSSPRAARSVS